MNHQQITFLNQITMMLRISIFFPFVYFSFSISGNPSRMDQSNSILFIVGDSEYQWDQNINHKPIAEPSWPWWKERQWGPKKDVTSVQTIQKDCQIAHLQHQHQDPLKIKDPQHDDWGWSWSKLIQSIVNESNSLSLTLDLTWWLWEVPRRCSEGRQYAQAWTPTPPSWSVNVPHCHYSNH